MDIATRNAAGTSQAAATAALAAERGKLAPESGRKLPPPEVKQESPTESVAKALEQIRDYLRSSKRELQFQVDDSSGRTVIRITNPQSGELIRQVPSEEVLKIAAAVRASNFRLIDEQG
jgi:flagellar protein FlaG